MVKHIQTIRRLLPNEMFGDVLPFCGIDTSGIKVSWCSYSDTFALFLFWL